MEKQDNMSRKDFVKLVGIGFFTSTLHACAPGVAKAIGELDQSVDLSSYESPSHTPRIRHTQTPTVTETPTPTVTATENPVTPTPEVVFADVCMYPVENFREGLLFMMPIKENDKPVKNKNGIVSRHLGYDLHTEFESPVVAPCDSEIVWVGDTRDYYGDESLGKVAVMKTLYEEGGETKEIYIRLAHLDSFKDIAPGTIVPMGTVIGAVGHSGGGWVTDHVHIDGIRADQWDVLFNSFDAIEAGDLRYAWTAGFYSRAEKEWDDGTKMKVFVDMEAWLKQRIPQ